MLQYHILVGVFLSLFGVAHAQVIDIRTGQAIDGEWIQTGAVSVGTANWVTVSPSVSGYIEPVVFLSTGINYAGSVDGYPIQSRMRNKTLTDDGTLSFQIKLVQPNDSYCSKEWWVPTEYPKLLDVTWMVMERGGYEISGTQTVVGYGSVNRNVSKILWDYTFGDVCHYPTTEGDNDYEPGAIVTLQTSSNGDTFLLPRSAAWFKDEAKSCSYSWKSGRFLLHGHDGLPADVRQQLLDEELGYLLFDPRPHVIHCADEMTMEFNGFSYISNEPVNPALIEPFTIASGGIFGVFVSLVTYSGGDAFAIRSYFEEDNTEDLFVYLQEDQCMDSETFHFQERATLLVMSSSRQNCTSISPAVDFYPTPTPTHAPTHRPSQRSPTAMPTTFEFGQQEAKRKKREEAQDGTGLLLAIILPIVIVAVIAIVGVGARAYFIAGAAGAMPLADSDHSGNNLIFDS